MPAQLAAMSGVVFKLQDAQVSGNGTALAIPMSFRNHTFLIKGTAGVTNGVLVIENSNDPNDTNVWDSLSGPINVVAGADLTFPVAMILNFVRARIMTPIVGGTVTVEYYGGKNY